MSATTVEIPFDQVRSVAACPFRGVPFYRFTGLWFVSPGGTVLRRYCGQWLRVVSP